ARLRLASTLFPYTTLFRSVKWYAVPANERRSPCGGETRGESGPASAQDPAAADSGSGGTDGGAALSGAVGDRHLPAGYGPPHHLDRKSTRLNSSHVSISYA